MSQLTRNLNGHEFGFVGQLVYQVPREHQRADALQGTGVRLYVEESTGRHFLCVDCAETGEEAWYEVDRVRLVPADELTQQPAHREHHK